MSDGREEREEQEKRRAQQQREDQSDLLERPAANQWQPERDDS